MSPKLTNEQARHLISEIISGQRIVEVSNEAGDLDILMFKIPSHIIKLRADLFYNKMLRRAIEDGILTRAQMEKIVAPYNLSNLMIDEEEEIKHKLERCRLLYTHSNHPVQKESKKKEIKSLERSLERIYNEREVPFRHTAEAKADQYRTIFLVVEGIYNLDGQKKWNSINDLINDKEYPLQNEVLIEYIKYASGYDTETARALARNNEWLIYWRSAKSTHCPVFSGSVAEWDVNKLLLVHWSQFYDDIMSHPDLPENILEDDDKLDKWLKDKRVVQERNSKQTVTTGADGKVKTTYHVNTPYKLISNREKDMMMEEDSANG